MNWEIMRSISHLLSMISMLLTKNIKRWDVSASKIHLWEFILLKILTDIGWKLYRANKKSFKKRNQQKLKINVHNWQDAFIPYNSRDSAYYVHFLQMYITDKCTFNIDMGYVHFKTFLFSYTIYIPFHNVHYYSSHVVK